MLKRAAWLILLTPLLFPGAAAWAEEPAPRRVEALLTLRFDPESQAVLWPEVEAILLGSPRAGWSGKLPAVFAEPPDTYRHIQVVREGVDEAGVICVRVNLESKNADPVLSADRLLDALVARVRAHAQAQAHRERKELDLAASGLARTIDERTKTISEGRAEGALPWPLSAAAFYENKLERRADLRRELADLELDAATLEARQKALAGQYEQLLQREAAVAAKSVDLSQEWAVILRARDAVVREVRAQVEAGTANPLDLAMAEGELGQARIQRAAALREARAPSDVRLDLEAAMLGFEVDAAALRATRSHLSALERTLTLELDQGKIDVLRVARLEDEAQVLRERLLGLRERLAAWREPAVDVLRLD